MRILLPAALATALLLSAACGSDRTRTPPPLATATATATVAETAPGITAENIARLKEAVSATVPNAQGIVWSSASDVLFVWNRGAASALSVAGGQPKEIVSVAAPEFVVAVSSLGQTATTSDFSSIDVHAKRDTAVAQTIRPAAPVTNAVFSPDGTLLALTRADHIEVDIWDIATGQMMKALSGFETAAPVYGVRFSPDAKTLVWVSRAAVQLQDIASGRLGPRFSHEDFVTGLAVSPDGKTLATAFASKVEIADATTGASLTTLNQDAPPLDLSFSPDGKLLAVVTGKGVAVWEVAAQKRVGVVGSGARQAAFAPDAHSLAGVDEDGTVAIWRP